MKKTTLIFLLIFNLVLNQATYDGSEAHELVLNDAISTIDVTTLTETPYNGVSILDGKLFIMKKNMEVYLDTEKRQMKVKCIQLKNVTKKN